MKEPESNNHSSHDRVAAHDRPVTAVGEAWPEEPKLAEFGEDDGLAEFRDDEELPEAEDEESLAAPDGRWQYPAGGRGEVVAEDPVRRAAPAPGQEVGRPEEDEPALESRAAQLGAPAGASAPLTRPSWLKRAFIQDGHLNRRAMMAASILAAFGFGWLMSGSGGQPAATTETAKSKSNPFQSSAPQHSIAKPISSRLNPENMQALDEQGRPRGGVYPEDSATAAGGARSAERGVFNAPAPGQPTAAGRANEPSRWEARPTSGGSVSRPAPPAHKWGATPAATTSEPRVRSGAPGVNAVEDGEARGSFSAKLHQRTDKESWRGARRAPFAGERETAPAATTKAGERQSGAGELKRGMRISMRLLEPATNSAESPVRAVVTEEVVDSEGQVVIPEGTEASVPFSGQERDARLFNSRNEATVFFLPQDEELIAQGTIKGLDDLPGIPGQVTGKRKQRRGLTRALTSGLSNTIGLIPGIGGFGSGVQDVAGDYTNPYGSGYSLQKIIVPAGTEFTFVVAL